MKGEIVDVADMNLNEVVDMIRGKAGTMVRLKVQPAIGGDPKMIDITRASIELKDEEARSEIFEEGHKPNGQPYQDRRDRSAELLHGYERRPAGAARL